MNIKDQLAMQKMYASGAFQRAKGAAAPSAIPTREDIATMDKAEVIQWLEAHGDEPDGRWGVDRLRERLVSLMLVEI